MCIKSSEKFTVYFEPPFWVGVFEKTIDNKMSTCKVVFGSEPKDHEIYNFILERYNQLKFSRFIDVEEEKSETKINPKRLQRIIKKQTSEVGLGTKAQQSLKAEYEANKVIRKKVTKNEKDMQKREMFQRKQEKKKLKKKGH